MKKNVLKEVPTLKSESGTLTGGFSALLPEQTRKLKGGIRASNDHCINELNCVDGTHNQCTNKAFCYSA